MALSMLLDEQISPDVAVQIQKKHPEIAVVSLHVYRDGILRGQPDARVLRIAKEASLTLVTYDLSTILPLLTEWGESGEDHTGVIFIDNRSLVHSDKGGQITALIQQWEVAKEWDWTNVVVFLHPKS